ncbi:uncharacterized protein LOC113209835 [Frankliniella occidentalis]|uniref:Uncharacterized protein LOC113209835 n=1 Tax=Frankliniella occidentalis TaxID=133901 RepID=A0A6J1SVI8_FRAOC|nr:uncharacterized protein LOC113209835 [Frankliniella occidentalis]
MAGSRTLTVALLVLLPLALALARPDGPTLPEAAAAQPRHRRSATEERRKWNDCIIMERQCNDKECSECAPGGKHDDCAFMCRWNCKCGCGGYPQAGADLARWGECYREERRCGETHSACKKGCAKKSGQGECESKCELDYKKCACECMQSSTSTSTSTTH